MRKVAFLGSTTLLFECDVASGGITSRKDSRYTCRFIRLRLVNHSVSKKTMSDDMIKIIRSVVIIYCSFSAIITRDINMAVAVVTSIRSYIFFYYYIGVPFGAPGWTRTSDQGFMRPLL